MGEYSCNACTVCGNGEYASVGCTNVSDTVCSACPAGYKCPSGQLIPCPRGTVSAYDKQTCTLCDSGTYVSGDQSECKPCEGNTYQEDMGEYSCNACTVCGN